MARPLGSRWTARHGPAILPGTLTPVGVRSIPLFALGIVLVLLGLYIPLHLLWSHAPITGYLWLDAAFALVFLVRGWMNIRSARRPRPTPGASP